MLKLPVLNVNLDSAKLVTWIFEIKRVKSVNYQHAAAFILHLSGSRGSKPSIILNCTCGYHYYCIDELWHKM